MATKKKAKPKNLIAAQTMKKHYTKAGKWKEDKDGGEEYDDVADYASEHPQYVFTSTEKPIGYVNQKTGKPLKYKNKYIAIHNPKFAKAMGWGVYNQFKHGGAVIRIGEAKVQ